MLILTKRWRRFSSLKNFVTLKKGYSKKKDEHVKLVQKKIIVLQKLFSCSLIKDKPKRQGFTLIKKMTDVIGNGCCGDCEGLNYPAVSSAFSLVPDNYNNVTNFVPKLPIYKNLRVCEKAVENVTCGRRGCTEKESFLYGEMNGCGSCGDECESFGFLGFPQRLRTVEVTVCGKAKCTKDTFRNEDSSTRLGGCGGNQCEPALLGFVEYPKFGYYRDVRTCGPIYTNAAKRRSQSISSHSTCKTIVKCRPCSRSSSSSSSSRVADAQRKVKKANRGARNGGCRGCR